MGKYEQLKLCHKRRQVLHDLVVNHQVFIDFPLDQTATTYYKNKKNLATPWCDQLLIG